MVLTVDENLRWLWLALAIGENSRWLWLALTVDENSRWLWLAYIETLTSSSMYIVIFFLFIHYDI